MRTVMGVTGILTIVTCTMALAGCGGGSGRTTGLLPPTGLSATPGDGSVSLDWNPVVGATSYKLYWSMSPGVTKATGNPLPVVSPPHTHGGLTNGTTYYYVVVSVRSGVESIESSEVSATPFPAGSCLDTTFWGQGFVVHHNAGGGDGSDVGRAIAVDSAGRIVVAGYSLAGSYWDMAIWRYNPDGFLDTTFNSQGWVTHDGAAGGTRDDLAHGLVLDPADGIFAVGHSQNSGMTDDLAIWHYDSSGTLDAGFGGGGVVSHNDAAGGSWHDRGMAITLETPSGRVYATGESHNGISFDMAIWAYDSTGTLDAGFGTGGVVTHDAAAGVGSTEGGVAIALDSSGRILVAGHGANAFGNYDMVIWAYDTAGVLDGSFGTGGVAVHDGATVTNSRDWGLGICIDPADRILVGGYSQGTTWDMVAWRYLSGGTLDGAFGTGGFLTHDSAAGGAADDVGSDITLGTGSRIIVTGYSDSASLDTDMVVWRYNDDGTLDTTFGSGGVCVHDGAAGGGGDDVGYAITRDGAGRILVTGSSANASGDNDMVIWRLWP